MAATRSRSGSRASTLPSIGRPSPSAPSRALSDLVYGQEVEVAGKHHRQLRTAARAGLGRRTRRQSRDGAPRAGLALQALLDRPRARRCRDGGAGAARRAVGRSRAGARRGRIGAARSRLRPRQSTRFPPIGGAGARRGEVHGNTGSRVFHTASCPNFRCRNCTARFASAEAARAAGYRPAGCCHPRAVSRRSTGAPLPAAPRC